MNIVILSGNIGADIDVQIFNGTTFAHFSVASNYRVPTGDGETYEKRTTWTRVTAFGPKAKPLGQLGKGTRVVVRGHLRTNTYETGGVRFQHSEVIADDVEFQRVKKPVGAVGAEEDVGAGEASEE